MKYIRTKDKIIDLTSKQVSSFEIIDDKTAIDEYGEDGGFIMVYYYNRDVGEHIEYDNKGGHSMDNWYLKDILKQADTIEELCDEFVGILPFERPYLQFYKTIYNFDDIKAHYLRTLSVEPKTEYYGAIWTDKGLIYVAKMKGILPNGEIDWKLL